VDNIVLSERTYCQDTLRMSNRCAEQCTVMTCIQCVTIGQEIDVLYKLTPFLKALNIGMQ